MWKYVIGGAKAVGPDKPPIFHDAPIVRDFSGGDFFSMRRAAEHQPLQGEEFRP